MALTLTENEFFRKTDITVNSANAKARAWFDYKELIMGNVSESTFKKGLDKYVDGDVPFVPDMAGVIAAVISAYYPGKKAKAFEACINASAYMYSVESAIKNDIYPKYEINILYKRYKASDGSYIDIPTGGTVTGKYTPTGQKITT